MTELLKLNEPTAWMAVDRCFRSFDRYPSFHQFHELYVAARGPVNPRTAEITHGSETPAELARENLAKLRSILVKVAEGMRDADTG